MSSRRFRNLLFRIHTWLGLHLCLLLGLIFATGTLLLYSPELVRINRGDLWLPASDWGQSKVSAGNIYDSLNSEHPDGWVDLITSKPRPWFGRLAYGSWGMANVNTATGEILGYGEGWQVRKVIRGLHDSLFVPIHLARIGVNFLSFIVIVMVVTGLITYRRFWKGYFRLPTRHADRRTRRGAWHRLVGVWAAPFLLASTLGSAVFFFKEIGWEAVTPTVGPLPERAAPLPEGFGGKALDALVSACTAEMPRFRESVVDMPDNAEQAVVISGHDMAVGKMLGWVGCHVDPETSEVVRTVRVSDGNTMASLYAIAVSIHYGAWGGVVCDRALDGRRHSERVPGFHRCPGLLRQNGCAGRSWRGDRCARRNAGNGDLGPWRSEVGLSSDGHRHRRHDCLPVDPVRFRRQVWASTVADCF